MYPRREIYVVADLYPVSGVENRVVTDNGIPPDFQPIMGADFSAPVDYRSASDPHSEDSTIDEIPDCMRRYKSYLKVHISLVAEIIVSELPENPLYQRFAIRLNA